MTTTEAALRQAMKNAVMYLETGFIRCPQCDHQLDTKDLDATSELKAALSQPSPASSPVAQEVMTLAIAARAAWEEMQDLAVSRLNLDNLDRALEAFSSRVPYENEPKGATASSPVGEGDNALLNTARRNIRTFINGASFKCSADKEAALTCVDVLESNLSQPTPASARDNQAIWDALRDFTLADGRTLESFFVKGNDKINFCCLIASLSPSSGEPASVAGEAGAPCQVCGNEVRGQGGYLQCECPAVSIPLSKPTPVEAGLREKIANVIHDHLSGICDYEISDIIAGDVVAALCEAPPSQE